MDKGNYETYEYLPTNGSESDQFFVVQDNGAFVISRQPVQYAPQDQNEKEALETVQVYNVTPQQFLVDVDNSSELISVSDQYILPDPETLYTNSYLLQPGTSAPPEPIVQDPSQEVAVEYKQADSNMNIDIADQINKQASSCTEITLTDDQYQRLEQKGWILLEISDKVYVLDTLGLHDITTNEKLIQKLKTEEQWINSQEIIQEIDDSVEEQWHNSQEIIQEDNGGKLEIDAYENNVTQGLTLQDTPNCIIENNIVVKQAPPSETVFKIDKEDNSVFNEVNIETPNIITSSETNIERAETQACEEQEDNEANTRVLVIENEDIRRVGNTLKVKTKLSLKDFPDKIVLGKMSNGKNMIAKVVKQTNDNELLTTEINRPVVKSQSSHNVPAIQLHNSNLLTESEFHLLMQHIFRHNITKCNAEDVVTADSIISQLLQIPSFKSSVIDNNLIITKTIHNEDSSDKGATKGLSALVTGKVSLIADNWRFIHLPQMLQDMVSKTEQFLANCKKDETLKREDFDILHVQISEAKQAVNDVVRVSVTVNKRNIPIYIITNKPKPQLSTMYACSYCAALFDTEPELKDHQKDNCLKQEDMLTIDIDQMIKPRDYCIVNTGKTKTYACMQCNAKFNRLTTCKNHLKTHYVPKNEDNKEKSQEKNNSYGIYKCNMCSSTYFHPSTLSKHILATHIKLKS